MDELTSQFERSLGEACVEALPTAAGFAELLDGLQGADPLAALAALRQIAATDTRLGGRARRLIEEATLLRLPELPSATPIVHPLDYHWRFSPATAEQLLDRAAELSGPGETVLFLVTPSLYQLAAERLAGRRCILFDRDSRICEAIPKSPGAEARVVDLLADQLPELAASCAVGDPPWYPKAIAGFAEAAAMMLRSDATLLLGFPAQLTRPGVRAEHAGFIRSARRLGFDPLEHERLALRYETPPFEYAAMGAAGLPSPPHEWRRGDLLALRLRRPITARARGGGIEEQWAAHQFEQIPIRVRPSAPAAGTELIAGLLEGDILPTVSRRTPLRCKAALWTSRNRIFASCDPPRLAQILASLEADGPSVGEAEAQVADQLAALVALERREHGLGAQVLAPAA